MMDDSMEISSEHGHNIRDEDIDIDIDFTTGHADEDYILEDVLPHETIDNDFLFEASPGAGQDDLMVDEGEDDETYHQVHTDISPDYNGQNIADEAAVMPFTATNGPAPYMEEHQAVHSDHFEVASARETVSPEHRDAPNGSAVETDLHLQDHKEPAIHKNEDHIDKVNSTDLGTEAPATPRDNTIPQPTSSHDHSPNALAPKEHPKSPSAALPKPADESPKRITSQDDLDISASHEYQEEALHGESEVAHLTEGSHVPAAPAILVLYQETEYALFSTSELDDPDSFFLSDTSILDSPISHFLKAIRDVIHEDLADEDELCLSMGDMGIEVEETSTLIQDITLRQILTLYEGLLHNDGVESPRPFCIQFGVRPNVLKRLANLAAGAAEGKGLSELISWAEHRTSPGASPEVADNTHGHDANTLEPEAQKSSDLEKEQGDAQESSEISQPLVPDADLKALRPAGSSSDKSAAPPSSKPESSQSINGNSNENYDEDDLIDYSDEEEETPDKRERNDEAGHGELQQEPLTRSTEDSLHDQSASHLEAAQGEVDGQDEEVSAENVVEYDEDNDESYYAETEAHEDDQGASANTDAVDNWQHEGNSQVPESEKELKSNEKSQDIDSDHEDLESEIGYDEEQDAETQELPRLSDEDLGLEGFQEKPLEDELVGNLAFGNTEPSENGTSSKTVEAAARPDEAPEDEIDYDDDDDEPIAPEALESLSGTTEKPLLLDGSGKRQREDANLDDGPSMGISEVKRRKS